MNRIKSLTLLFTCCFLLAMASAQTSYAVMMEITSGAEGYIDWNLNTEALNLFDTGYIEIYLKGSDPESPLMAVISAGGPSATDVWFFSDDLFFEETGSWVEGWAFFDAESFEGDPSSNAGSNIAYGVSFHSLTFSGFGYELTAEVPGPAPVPEPATIWLLCTGLVAITGIRKK